MKLFPDKKLFLFIFMVFSFGLTAQQTKINCFIEAKNELENMLNGTKALDYERAVFITENAYYDNKMSYQDFQNVLNEEQFNVKYLIDKIKPGSLVKPRKNILVSTDSETVNINRLVSNYAIYNYITNITFNKIDSSVYMHDPYSYALSDPLAAADWRNTHVVNLIADNGPGNCMALTSLFKILSLRLNSNANLCTTQGHIFITHADENGRLYNVELGSKAFPGTGSIETITHTTDEAARNGISMRELNLKQSVAICLLNLAKGYQHKFLIKPDAFMLDCANLILKYDSLNLNAMLLKAEVLEENLISQQKPFAKIKITKDFIEYEKYINKLYKLGYREMPTEMKNQIIAAITQDTTYLGPIRNSTFDPFETIANNKSRSASLSNGMFEEFDIDKPKEKYFRTVFETKTKKIIAFSPVDILYNKYEFDPVAFAWQVDPLASKFAAWSPYAALADNPIRFIDPDGADIVDAQGRQIAVINKEGNVEFTEFATEKVKSVLGLANETKIGNQVLKNAITAKHNIEFSISPKAVIDGAVTSKPIDGKAITLGKTISDENEDKTDFTKSEVVVYEGSVKQYQKEGRSADYNGKKISLYKYSLKVATASTAIHELTHATDKKANPDIKGTVNGTQENKPKENQIQFLEEIDSKTPKK